MNAMQESNYNLTYFTFYDYFYICTDTMEDQINEWMNEEQIF